MSRCPPFPVWPFYACLCGYGCVCFCKDNPSIRVFLFGEVCIFLSLPSPHLELSFSLLPMSEVSNVMHVPVCDGHASSFANSEEKVSLRNQIPTMDPPEQAADLLLHMTDVARMVCTFVGKDAIGSADGVARISCILRERFAPDASDSGLQDVAKFMFCKRAAQDMDTYLMEFGVLRRKAEARALFGGGFPDEFVSVLRMQNTVLSKNGKTFSLDSLRNTLASPEVPAETRRLVGPRGYASRQDAFVSADMAAVAEEEDSEA